MRLTVQILHLFFLSSVILSPLSFGGNIQASEHGNSTATPRVIQMQDLHGDELYFPRDFKWGFAIAEQQNSGADNLPNSNWSRWEQTKFANGQPHIKGDQRSGKSCDHWNLYKEDIKLMKEDFNANAFRFSVAWDRIEPVEGLFSQEALQHYSDEVDALLANGIEPMITLHHFAHPQWFENKGAFERRKYCTLCSLCKKSFRTVERPRYLMVYPE